MKKSLLLLLNILVFMVASSNAAVYKGRKYYVKQCRPCHNVGEELVSTKTQEYWAGLMKNNGKGLAEMHISMKAAEDSWEYFKSKKYAKKSRHLKDFLNEFASDSGNIPACQ